MEIYAALNYSVGAIGICKAIRGAEACETKFEIAQTLLQDCTGFSGTVLGKRSAGHFVFKCSTYACYWRNTSEKLDGEHRYMAGGVNYKIVA